MNDFIRWIKRFSPGELLLLIVLVVLVPAVIIGGVSIVCKPLHQMLELDYNLLCVISCVMALAVYAVVLILFYNYDWLIPKKKSKPDTALSQGETFPSQTDAEAAVATAPAKKSLGDYLINIADKEMFIRRIFDRLSSSGKGIEVAYMYCALMESGLLSSCDSATFHELLSQAKGDIDIKSLRNLQKHLKNFHENVGNGKRVMDIGEDRENIDAWKKYLENCK